MHDPRPCPSCTSLGSIRAKYGPYDLYYCGEFVLAIPERPSGARVSHINPTHNDPRTPQLLEARHRYMKRTRS